MMVDNNNDNNNKKRRNLLLLAVISLLKLAGAQDTGAADSTTKACNQIFDCDECLSNTNNCVFAVGTCFDVCREPDNGATCYSTRTFTEIASNDICDLYNGDNARCTSQRSCGECVATLKSDGKPCQWYESAGACFGGGTGPFGSGALVCPTSATSEPEGPPLQEATPVPSTPVPSTTPPTTPAPTITIGIVPVPTTAPTADELLDQANCLVQTDCGSCTSTILSDGTSTCFWFADTQQCSNENCLQKEEDATATTIVASCDGVSTCNATTAESLCQAAGSDCQSCLGANCAWFPLFEQCAPSCAGLQSDADLCYSAEGSAYQDLDSTAICQLAASETATTTSPTTTTAADRELCFAQLQCSSCTATMQSTGAMCQWYIDESTGVQWCQTGGCDTSNSGICGSDICATADNAGAAADAGEDAQISEEQSGITEDSATTTTNITDNSSTENNTTPDDTTGDNITVTTDGEVDEETSDGSDASDASASAGGGSCDGFDGYGSDGCLPCLTSANNNCAWVLETCVPDCADIADAPCYSLATFPNLSPEEICDQANVSQEDVALCGSKNYCFTCTSTIKSDGVTTCSWYTNEETGDEWCDVGGCNVDGICGESDEAICQQPEDNDNLPDEEDDEDAADTQPTDTAEQVNGAAAGSSGAFTIATRRRWMEIFSNSMLIVAFMSWL